MAPENMPYTPNDSYEEKGVAREQKKKLKVVIADVDYEDAARDAADASMTADKAELKGFRGFCKKIWKHNILQPYYHNKELAKARRRIQESGNSYVNEEKGDKSDHDNAMKALVERYVSDYDDTYTVHAEAGEKKKILSEEMPEEQDLKSKIQDMIGRYAKGEIDEAQFLKEKDDILQNDVKRIKGNDNENIIEKGNMYATNLLEIANEVRTPVLALPRIISNSTSSLFRPS